MTIMHTMIAIMTHKVFLQIYLVVNMVHQIADFAGNLYNINVLNPITRHNITTINII
jgi:hypothetical protein